MKEIKYPKDIIVVNEKDFEKYSTEKWINSLYYEIKKKGIILYEKNSIKI